MLLCDLLFFYNLRYMVRHSSQAPAAEIADLLGGSFPGHTMQRIRTPSGDYRYSYVSPSVLESFGLDPGALMDMKSVDHAWVHPDDRVRFVAALETSAATLSRLDEEIRVARAGGGYKWVRSLGTPRRQADGTVIWDGVALDVTERREALEALQRTLVQVRNDEASEGRFSYIAAADVSARLQSLREAIASASTGSVGADPAVSAIADAFDRFERAFFAARDLVAASPKEQAGAKLLRERVTGRQADILDILFEGASNLEIARRLGLTEGTVKLHVSAALKRLGVSNRTEAARAWASGATPRDDMDP
jgi:PAS domain S-box-containing protein